MRHDPLVAILDMLNAASRAVRRVEGLELSDFVLSEDAQWVVWSQIVIIGEAANRVPKELQAAYPSVPWSLAIGMRNRVVHGYDAIDWDIVFNTAKTDLRSLVSALSPLVPNEGSAANP